MTAEKGRTAPRRNLLRTAAKKTLGKTPLWVPLLKIRYYLLEAPGGAGAKTRLLLQGAARTLRRGLNRILPRRTVYRLLQSQDFYDARYFDAAKDPLRESGYAEAYSYSEDFRGVASLCRDLFRASRVLDVGCAKGFQVAALQEAGMEAWGIDISEYAVRSAPPRVASRLKVGGCGDIDFPDGFFDLVLAMEVLEHVPPTEIEEAVEELHRVTSRWVWVTIPSYGENPFGPDGCVEGKVEPKRVDYYRKFPVDRVAFRHLARDVHGLPIHGHLITATFDWWTALFTSKGFCRRGDMEREVNARLEPAAAGTWNCMVFEKAREVTGGSGPSVPAVLGFEARGDEGWKTESFILPEGVHAAGIELEVRWMNWRKPDEHRLLRAACLSADDSRILGLRLLDYGEARRKRKGGKMRFTMTCSTPRGERAYILLLPADESRLLPLSVEMHFSPAGEREPGA